MSTLNLIADWCALIGLVLVFIHPANIWHSMRGWQKAGYVLLLVGGLGLLLLMVIGGFSDAAKAAGDGFMNSPFH